MLRKTFGRKIVIDVAVTGPINNQYKSHADDSTMERSQTVYTCSRSMDLQRTDVYICRKKVQISEKGRTGTISFSLIRYLDTLFIRA